MLLITSTANKSSQELSLRQTSPSCFFSLLYCQIELAHFQKERSTAKLTEKINRIGSSERKHNSRFGCAGSAAPAQHKRSELIIREDVTDYSNNHHHNVHNFETMTILFCPAS